MISNELVKNHRIREIINTDFKDKIFIEHLRKVIEDSAEKNEIYRRLIENSDFSIDDLEKIDDLMMLPYLNASDFKESNQMYKRFLKIPFNSPEFDCWNVSSCTSGNPSLVSRSKDDNELLASMTIKCIYDFIPIPQDEWFNTLSFNFAPSIKFLNRIALRYTEERPVKLYSSNLHKISTRMSDPYFLVKFKLFKAIKEIIVNRSIVGAFNIDSKFVIKKLEKNLKKPENERKYVSFGGSLQLVNNFMNGFLEDNNLKYELNDSVVNFGGGGWDGHKSQLKYPPIEKNKFVNDCEKYLGTPPENITDMYGFTETPIVFGSHWSEKHQDFIMHCPPQARIIIRDMKTRDPLTSPGDVGFLEVITPFGVNASLNHAILIDDVVELVSKKNCPQCGYEGDTFRVLGRLENSEGLGCSSVVEWI